MKSRLLTLAALLLPLLAQAQPAAPAPARPLGELLDESGHLRLDAGFRGSIDARGWRLAPDASGTPRFVAAPDAAAAASPDDPYWDDRFFSNGVGGWVYAITQDASGNLYVGGLFSGGIAMWDGTRWSLPGGGVAGNVNTLVADGLGNVYAGGGFNVTGPGGFAFGVARWDGANWHPLGDGVDGTVYALALHGSDLYAGGTFSEAGGAPAANIARWNGTAWSSLGAGVDGQVNAIAFDANDDLVVGGTFLNAGGAPARRIARWDGTGWSPLGDGIDGASWSPGVRAMAFDDGLLYVGGQFSMAGDVPSTNVAVWDGAGWSSPGGGIEGDQVLELAVYDGTLYAGGSVLIEGSGVAVVKWNGTAWTTEVGYSDNIIQALHFESDGTLYAGGSFYVVEGVQANFVARRDGAWSALGAEGLGLYEQVWAVATDGAGQVYAISRRVDDPANTFKYGVKKWTGAGWTDLGDAFDGQVLTLAVDDAGNVYAGGMFGKVGNLPVGRVAKWDGTAWSPLGTGIGPMGYVLSLDCYGNLVYVGGNFTQAGGVRANNIARWNGRRWSALGGGTSDGVRAIAVRKDGVYAGGYFDTAGGVTVNKVARWDGTAWSALGSGISGFEVDDLHLFEGKLYAAGFFWQAGSTVTNGVARWTGTDWERVGTLSGFVYSLASSNGKLYAAGVFGFADGLPVNNVARWDGRAWSSLGSGINGAATAIAADAQDRVYVGGQFMAAGGKLSYNFALFAPEGPALTLTAPGAGSYAAGSPLRITWTSTELPPLSRVYVDLVGPVAGGEAPPVTRLKVTANDGVWKWPIPANQAPGSYRIRLTSALNPALTDESDAFTVTAPVEAAARAGVPAEVVLEEAYPNPFNPTTTISFVLPEASAVRLEVFDLLGRRVALLADGVQEAGAHAVRFDGAALASGTYLSRLQAGDVVLTRRMVLMK